MSMRRRITEQLVRVGPHGTAHWVALRAAITVALPLAVLVLIDQLDWALYAGFGAFTSLYGRSSSWPGRGRMQARVGAVLVAAIMVGVGVGTSDQRAWWVIPVATLGAALGSALSDRDQWHPPGPLFLVFALCACASVPSSPSDLVPALLVSSATVVFAVVVGGLGPWWRARGTQRVAERPVPHPVEGRHVARGALSVALAGTLATAFQIGHPYWAMVSAVVPLAAKAWEAQVVRGIHRIVGTGLGLVLAGVLLAADLPTAALVVAIVVLQGAAELLIGRNYALALVAITPLALLMVSLASPIPTGVLLQDRAVETVIGVLVGMGVGWFTRART